jgi:hypothetical protein
VKATSAAVTMALKHIAPFSLEELMTWIKQVRDQVLADVRARKNLELYFLMPVAAVAAVGGAVGWAKQEFVLAVTLALLAVLGVSLLKINHNVDTLQDVTAELKSPPSPASLLFRKQDDIEDIKRSIRASRDIWLWGSALTQHIGFLAGTIGESMESNDLHVKVLLIKPSSSAVEMAAFRAPNYTTAQLEIDLAAGIDKLKREASARDRGNLQIRVVDYLAPYTLYGYDPVLPRNFEPNPGTPGTWEPNPAGHAEMRLTSFKGDHDYRPTFTLYGERDHGWYSHFCTEFTKVWAVADPV